MTHIPLPIKDNCITFQTADSHFGSLPFSMGRFRRGSTSEQVDRCCLYNGTTCPWMATALSSPFFLGQIAPSNLCTRFSIIIRITRVITQCVQNVLHQDSVLR